MKSNSIVGVFGSQLALVLLSSEGHCRKLILHNGLYREEIIMVLLSVCVCGCACLLGFVSMFVMSTLYGSITVNLAICFLKLNCQK